MHKTFRWFTERGEMKLLVTGGAGFIGSNFIRHILNRHTGYRIINLDKTHLRRKS